MSWGGEVDGRVRRKWMRWMREVRRTKDGKVGRRGVIRIDLPWLGLFVDVEHGDVN